MKFKLKRGDEVVVIAGSNRGKRGNVLEVIPTSERVVVEGVNMRKKHTKGTQERPEASIIEREMPVHYSNLQTASKYDAKRANKK
jgi:large subunit ribosomal protein L24